MINNICMTFILHFIFEPLKITNDLSRILHCHSPPDTINFNDMDTNHQTLIILANLLKSFIPTISRSWRSSVQNTILNLFRFILYVIADFNICLNTFRIVLTTIYTGKIMNYFMDTLIKLIMSLQIYSSTTGHVFSAKTMP